jgi:hypothetical protein
MNETIGSFASFQKIVQDLQPGFLFRGQANSLHKIQPGIGRWHPQYTATPALEKALIHQFKNRSVKFFGGPKPQTEWDWLITAQHHGLKTRLLDWTADWRVALYFASQPHEEMRRVPFSISFLLPDHLMEYEKLPKNPFTIKRDYFFQPPHLDERITSQSAYMSVHSNPYKAIEDPKLFQFNFSPHAYERSNVAAFLASSRITAAEITPGLDGLCKALVDEPRITAQIQLPPAKPLELEPNFRPIPDFFIGKEVGTMRKELIENRSLSLILDMQDVENMIGIPVYLDEKLFGLLKYANRTLNVFLFLKPDGTGTIKVLRTDEKFERLRLGKRDIEQIVPEHIPVIRRIRKRKLKAE